MTPHPKSKRLRDRAYLDSFADMACLACGRHGAIAAHIRHGLGGGISLKPDDSMCVPLCHVCHVHQHSKGEVRFWASSIKSEELMKLLRVYATHLYQTWKEKQNG